MAKELAKFHEIEVSSDLKVTSFYLDFPIEKEDPHVFAVKIDLAKLEEAEVLEIREFLKHFNKESNPLIYEYAIANQVLEISMQHNPKYTEENLQISPRNLDILSDSYIDQTIEQIEKMQISKELKEDSQKTLLLAKATLPQLRPKLISNKNKKRFSTLNHNDVNSYNILVGPQKQVYLIDYDLVSPGCFVYDLAVFIYFMQFEKVPNQIKFENVHDVTSFYTKIASVYLQERPLDISVEHLVDLIKFYQVVLLFNYALTSFSIALNPTKSDLVPRGLHFLKHYLVAIKGVLK